MKYDVILYPVVIVKVCGVEAESQVAAIDLARDHAPLRELFQRTIQKPVFGLPGATLSYTDWADGFENRYLVDEVGDTEYLRSQFYYDGPGPNGYVAGYPGAEVPSAND